MRNSSLLVILVVAFISVATSVSAGGGRQLAKKLVGRQENPTGIVFIRENITDLNDPHVLAIAKFAIGVNNAKTHGGLSLGHVICGRRRFADGTTYRLDLAVVSTPAAASGDVDAAYEAVVFEAVNGSLKFVSFTLVPEAFGISCVLR